MKRNVILRPEMTEATLDLGGTPINLEDYATTGLLALAVGPRGSGKTNAGLLMAEQLAEQGWVSVIVDPEKEMESLYGDAVADPEELAVRLAKRDQAIVVVCARNATEFIPYGRVILDAADQYRKPIFLMIDEGQIFSSSRKRSDGMGEAADLVNDFAERGRKRALDLFVTAHRFSSSIHRSLFSNKNLTLFGCQEDPTVWSALAPQFRGTSIEYKDLNALAPGEFFCFSRRGLDKVRMPMAAALKHVAPKAKAVKHTLPVTFTQWNRAMRDIPGWRLNALSNPVIDLLGAVAGLSAQQMSVGIQALAEELEARS